MGKSVALKVQAHPKHPLFSPASLFGLPELMMGESWRPLIRSTWLTSHGDLCSFPAVLSIINLSSQGQLLLLKNERADS